MRWFAVVLVVVLGFWSTAAAAEEGLKRDKKQEELITIREPDREVVRSTTKVDFNEFQLEGELTRPQGGYVPSREQSQFDSLLKPRQDFLPELERSAEGF